MFYLIADGPRVNEILVFSAFLGMTNALQWLLSSGRVPVNDRKPFQTPTVAAVISRYIDAVQRLIHLGMSEWTQPLLYRVIRNCRLWPQRRPPAPCELWTRSRCQSCGQVLRFCLVFS
jgi:hypothetical protein